MPLYPNKIDTVGDLIAALSDYDPQLPIRWAGQPGWAMAYTIGPVVCTPEDVEGSGWHHNSREDNAVTRTADRADEADEVDDSDSGDGDSDDPVVWLGEGQQIGYLPGVAATALGWS